MIAQTQSEKPIEFTTLARGGSPTLRVNVKST